MSRRVPPIRGNPQESMVRVARPASGGFTWARTGALVNHVLGRGKQLVPSHCPLTESLLNTIDNNSGNPWELRYRVKPRFQAAQRRYFLRLRSAIAGFAINVEVEINGTSVGEFAVPPDIADVVTLSFIEDLTSASASEEEITIGFLVDGAYGFEGSDGAIYVDAVSVWEAPRLELATGTNDLGTDISRLRSGQPILAEDLANLQSALENETLIGDRQLVAWAVPDDTSYASANGTTSFQDVGPDGWPALARKLRRTATTVDVEARVLAWVTGGTGQVRINSSRNGLSTVASFTSTSPTWVTISNSLTVDAENLSAADGLQSSTFDVLRAQFRITSASFAAYVAAVCIGEY